MSMFNTIKGLQLQARKEKNIVLSSLYSCLISDAVKVATTKEKRDPTDEEIVALVKKFKVSSEEMMRVCTDYDCQVNIEIEIEALNSLLPTQLNEDELTKIISGFISTSDKVNMGAVMAYLKASFNGQYDGALASKIAKTLL